MPFLESFSFVAVGLTCSENYCTVLYSTEQSKQNGVSRFATNGRQLTAGTNKPDSLSLQPDQTKVSLTEIIS